jgi:hypothetical protein
MRNNARRFKIFSLLGFASYFWFVQSCFLNVFIGLHVSMVKESSQLKCAHLGSVPMKIVCRWCKVHQLGRMCSFAKVFRWYKCVDGDSTFNEKM